LETSGHPFLYTAMLAQATGLSATTVGICFIQPLHLAIAGTHIRLVELACICAIFTNPGWNNPRCQSSNIKIYVADIFESWAIYFLVHGKLTEDNKNEYQQLEGWKQKEYCRNKIFHQHIRVFMNLA
jgi:hypothetical protein